MYVHVNIFKYILYVYVLIHTVHIRVVKQKLLFWMRLIMINRLTALIYIYIYLVLLKLQK